LRQEYVDFGNSAFSWFAWPGQTNVQPSQTDVPARNQIAPASDPLYNWGYYQAPTANFLNAPGLIAINAPPGTDVMGPLLADLNKNFNLLAGHLDIASNTQPTSPTDKVITRRMLTIYDITVTRPSTVAQERPFSYPFSGNTDPVYPNQCDGNWADINGNPYPMVLAPSTTGPSGYKCVGDILAGPAQNGVYVAASVPNNRTNNLNVNLHGAVRSAYRNPQKQYDIPSSVSSFHTQGRALDINPSYIPDMVPYKTGIEQRCLLHAAALPDTQSAVDQTLGWASVDAWEVFSEKGTTFYPCNATTPTYPSETDHVHIAR